MSNYSYYFWALLLISAVLFFAPITVEERVGLGLDKAVHFGLFFLLHVLVVRCYENQHGRLFWYLLLYVIAAEFIQGEFLSYRSFDVLDMIFGLGGLVAAHIYDKWAGHSKII